MIEKAFGWTSVAAEKTTKALTHHTALGGYCIDGVCRAPDSLWVNALGDDAEVGVFTPRTSIV